MVLDYFAADRQTHAGARNLLTVKTFKKAEDRSLILRPNTDAIVPHTEDPLVFILQSANFTRGTAAERYLIALLMRFWKTCTICASRARTDGR